MSAALAPSDDAPISGLNTTPLIDIMLVLLVMFIVTVPLQTHAVKMSLPQTPKVPPPDMPRADYNTVAVDSAGQVRWNGNPVDLVTLRRYLDLTRTMVPEPALHIDAARDARYARVDEMLAVVNRSGVSKVGFIGNERYADFGR
jgi:biopolymer transport protein ExbD